MQQGTDKTIFIIRPSQWANFGWFLFAVIGCILIIPLLLGLWNFFVIKYWEYQFGERTITERKGVLSVEKTEIHYFRIKSIKVEQPFFLRIVGLSNIVIITSDPGRHNFQLYAIGNGDKIRDYIKEMTYFWRKKLNVSEHDIFNL